MTLIYQACRVAAASEVKPASQILAQAMSGTQLVDEALNGGKAPCSPSAFELAGVNRSAPVGDARRVQGPGVVDVFDIGSGTLNNVSDFLGCAHDARSRDLVAPPCGAQNLSGKGSEYLDAA